MWLTFNYTITKFVCFSSLTVFCKIMSSTANKWKGVLFKQRYNLDRNQTEDIGNLITSCNEQFFLFFVLNIFKTHCKTKQKQKNKTKPKKSEISEATILSSSTKFLSASR